MTKILIHSDTPTGLHGTHFIMTKILIHSEITIVTEFVISTYSEFKIVTFIGLSKEAR